MEEVMRSKISFLSFGTEIDNISSDEEEQDEMSSDDPLDFLENDKKNDINNSGNDDNDSKK